MQIIGKCKIANQWKDGAVDKNSFDFENKGKVAKGRLTWSDVIKGKDGAKDTFISTTKKFLCFGANIDFIEQNLGQQFEIVGNLKTTQFTNNEGKVVKFDEIMINEVKLAEKYVSKHVEDKSNGYAPQANHIEEELDDSLPF
jgi:single-stranded DNA-binding protein